MKRLALLMFVAAMFVAPVVKADVLSNDYVDVKLGGYLKLDMYFNTNKVVNIDSPLWISNDIIVKENSTDLFYKDGKTYGATVRGSRLWLDVYGKNLPENLKLKMHIETDFYGDYATSTTGPRLPQMALRHYFATLTYKKVSFVAGQTWVIAAPLHPSSFDTLVLAGKGNLWQRLPQLSVHYKTNLAEKHALKLAFGVMRPLSARDTKGALVDSGSVGEITGIPMLQGRVAYVGENIGGTNVEVGLSGSFHMEKYTTSGLTLKDSTTGATYSVPLKNDDPVKSWLVAFDLSLKLNKIGFKTEWYFGQNLDTFWGDMIKWGAVPVVHTNGVKTWAKMKSVREFGGFANFCVKPINDLFVNVGFGLAQIYNISDYYTDYKANYNMPEAATTGLKLTSNPTPPIERQMAGYLNFAYAITKGFLVGYEIQYMNTSYYDKYMKDTFDKDDTLVHNLWNNLMVKYTF